MKKCTPRNVRIVIISAIAYVLFLYLPNSLAGYLSFCDKILGDEVDCYDSNNVPMLIARILLPFSVSFSYPLYISFLKLLYNFLIIIITCNKNEYIKSINWNTISK